MFGMKAVAPPFAHRYLCLRLRPYLLDSDFVEREHSNPSSAVEVLGEYLGAF